MNRENINQFLVAVVIAMIIIVAVCFGEIADHSRSYGNNAASGGDLGIYDRQWVHASPLTSIQNKESGRTLTIDAVDPSYQTYYVVRCPDGKYHCVDLEPIRQAVKR